MNYDRKNAFKTSDITLANISPIIHFRTARSVRKGASSCCSLVSRYSLVTSSFIVMKKEDFLARLT
jgi:hypothetical protein